MSQVYAINRERWATFSIFEQMGNIYSEVGRTFAAKSRGDLKGYEQAMMRAIDLFDATVTVLIAKHSPQSKEVLRAKEVFLSACTNDTTAEQLRSIDHYFMQFAIAERLGR